MKKAKYRIKELRVEGFRGFTVPQTIHLASKNLFVFGLNGHGKSSIVEAIRWCLFGAPSGGDIEVRNTFYDAQECCVSLLLESADHTISVQREFRPGHDRSRQTIRDSAGKILLAGNALPQLARLGHHESAQVIFAAQHAAGRQVPADISNFRTVLCFYLRLENVPALLDALRNLYEERAEEAEKLSGQIEQLEQHYRDQLRDIQARLTVLMENPPWGEIDTPTGTETSEKIKLFVSKIARLFNKEVPVENELSELLTHAQRWIESGALNERTEREKRRDALKAQTEKADGLLNLVRQAKAELDVDVERRKEFDVRLNAILHGETRESLRGVLEKLESEKTEYDARQSIARQAKVVCEAHPTDSCPACGTKWDPEALIKAIEGQCDINQAFDDKLLEGINQRLIAITKIDAANDILKERIESKTREADQASKDLAELLGVSVTLTNLDAVKLHLVNLQTDMQNLTNQMVDAEAEKQRELKSIRALQQELKYHEYRDQTKSIERKLTDGMREAQDLLRDYRNLLARTAEIQTLVLQLFKEALDKAIPTLDEMFSDVYRRLTQQQSYDLVRVHHDPEHIGSLELRVASTRLPGQTFPANVLNGQASKALHLVPYFVFSRFQPEVMELDLLLIDDPSESFDTSHVGLLVQELAEAAQHAQLVVASHEREKFEPLLGKQLGGEPYAIITVNGFDPIQGPQIVEQPTRV